MKLKKLLNKIDSINMVVVNLYFDKNILPAEVSSYATQIVYLRTFVI